MRPTYVIRDLFEDVTVIENLPNVGFLLIEGKNESSHDKVYMMALFEYDGIKKFDGIQNQDELLSIRNNKLIGIMDLTKELMVNRGGPFEKVINSFGYTLLNLGVKI